MHHTGAALARHGFVVICPDALCFEEREAARASEFGAAAPPAADASNEGGLRAGGLSGGDLERFEFLRYVVSGRSLAWKSVLDIRRSVDLLVSRPEVDASRIGDHPTPTFTFFPSALDATSPAVGRHLRPQHGVDARLARHPSRPSHHLRRRQLLHAHLRSHRACTADPLLPQLCAWLADGGA